MINHLDLGTEPGHFDFCRCELNSLSIYAFEFFQDPFISEAEVAEATS